MGFFPKRKIPYAEAREDAIKSIREFLDGTGGEWDWDDFISVPTGFKDLDELRGFCSGLHYSHPSTKRNEYCNEEGFELLRKKLKDLEDKNTMLS
jgi:hypothetical protein